MASTKEIKQRIKGIKSTGKITRAMEMISAVKMRKAVTRVMAIRPYAEGSLHVLLQVSKAMKEEKNPLMEKRILRRVLFVVITSNKGLCSSFNTQVMRQVGQEIETLRNKAGQSVIVDFISLGKKGDMMLRRFDGTIQASFPDALTLESTEGFRPIAQYILEHFENETYDKVKLIYTDYVSALSQKTKSRRLLPLSVGAFTDEITEMSHGPKMMYEQDTQFVGKGSPDSEDANGGFLDDASQLNAEMRGASKPEAIYVIEPNPERVFRVLVPRMLEMQLQHAILESNASQESARMMAMRNATDAAKDMVAEYTQTYNQLRQAKVTQEIAELSAGMAAVGG